MQLSPLQGTLPDIGNCAEHKYGASSKLPEGLLCMETNLLFLQHSVT